MRPAIAFARSWSVRMPLDIPSLLIMKEYSGSGALKRMHIGGGRLILRREPTVQLAASTVAICGKHKLCTITSLHEGKDQGPTDAMQHGSVDLSSHQPMDRSGDNSCP